MLPACHTDRNRPECGVCLDIPRPYQRPRMCKMRFCTLQAPGAIILGGHLVLRKTGSEQQQDSE